jgi:sec-independent protein translocase protein TatB
MFDIGWSELLVIGVVALIVVGPKDLPRMFRTLGEFTGKARKMAREFQTAMNDAAEDSGVKDIAGDLRKAADPKQFGLDAIKDATGELSAWNPDEADGKAAKPDAGLSPDRAAARDKIQAATAARAEARLAAEAAEMSDEPDLVPDPAAAAPKQTPRKQTKPKQAAAKPAAAKSAAPKAPAARKPAAKKPAAKKPAARKPAAKKPSPAKSEGKA